MLLSVWCWPEMTGHARLPCLVIAAELFTYDAKLGNAVSFNPSFPS